ncbi:MAG: membrane protein insertion efficiency factor YidD [Clostridia bacterium]|nr:membrane protein insertion efficiency factor YidD [Clostridia bacterium]
MKYIAIWLVKFYRKFISPLKPPCCRFTPTCSQYAIEAFREWGFICGLGLTIWRVLRCNPYCKGGYDPVPECEYRRGRRARTQEKNQGEN